MRRKAEAPLRRVASKYVSLRNSLTEVYINMLGECHKVIEFARVHCLVHSQDQRVQGHADTNHAKEMRKLYKLRE